MVVYGQPRSQFIEDALINGINLDSERFFRTKFDNASEDHVSTFRGQLNKRTMWILKSQVEKIVQGYEDLTRGMTLSKEDSDLAKEMYIANYLLRNVSYTHVQFAEGGNVFGGHSFSNSVYGALVYHDAVCSGVSEAVDCLNKVMGLESRKLLTTPQDPFGGGHAFNIVKIGDDWYELDITAEIGLMPGSKVRGNKWVDNRFLVPFSEPHRRACIPHVPDCTRLYPREKIEAMRHRLEERGLSFDYNVNDTIHREEQTSSEPAFKIKRTKEEFTIKKVGLVDAEYLDYIKNQIRLAKESHDTVALEYWNNLLSGTKKNEPPKASDAEIEYVKAELEKAIEAQDDVTISHWRRIYESIAPEEEKKRSI